jgi:hypothetical protein
MIREHLSLQGNPAVTEDWWTNPKTGEQVDFIDFCRSEGRFSKHFDKDGNPSELLLAAKEDRRQNWRLLQELAGVLGGKPEAKSASGKVASKPAAVKTTTQQANGKQSALPAGFRVGSKIKYNDGTIWVGGVLRSASPIVLALDDQTKIEVSAEVLREAVSVGIVTLQDK